MSEKRYLILAEGRSDDPHYGKTARGVLAYGAEPVVAILDSTRAGETYDGIPIVGSVNDSLCFNPTTALVGVATQGGRFPPEWRELLKSCIAKGLDLENGLHEFVSDDAELSELAARHNVELRDLRKAPADLDVPTGENMQLDTCIVLTVGSDCAIGKMTVSLELDRAARERGLASQFVPTGQTGIAIAGWGIAVDAVVSDFIAGATERLVVEGYGRGGTDAALRRGPGLDRPSGVLRRDDGLDPRQRTAPLCVVSPGRNDRDRGVPRSPAALARRRWWSSTSDSRFPHGRQASPVSPSTRAFSAKRRRTPRSRRLQRKPGFPRTIPSGSGPKSCSRPSSKAACRLPRLPSIRRMTTSCEFFSR